MRQAPVISIVPAAQVRDLFIRSYPSSSSPRPTRTAPAVVCAAIADRSRAGLYSRRLGYLKEMLVMETKYQNSTVKLLANIVFASRWLQAPLYQGLIVAQGVYVYLFVTELVLLVQLAHSIGETEIMLVVLGLIDVVMIANLLLMVIVGGYETFVSRLHLDSHADQPEWLEHVNAGTVKVKLSMALIGISSIHLLKTFIEAPNLTEQTMLWQVVIHMAFVLSAMAMAYTNRLMEPKAHY